HGLSTVEQIAALSMEDLDRLFADGHKSATEMFVPIDLDQVTKKRMGRNKAPLKVLWSQYLQVPAALGQRHFGYDRFCELATGLTPRGWTRPIQQCWGSEIIEIMARKNYSEDFKRQAVDLYENTEGATLRGISADLGISRGTLSAWVKTLGTGAQPAGAVAVAPGDLEAENRRLRAEKRKLEIERDTLRQAAKYFAGEMTW